MGSPQPSCIALSISGTLPTPRSPARIASSRYGTSSKLTMKPELSFAATGSLPSDRANANARWNVSAEVVTVRTTSTSGISGTGLKKWSPTKRSPRFVAAAIAAIVRLDVFEAKMVAGPHKPSSSVHKAFLSSRSSVTASTTMSLVLRSAVAVVKRSGRGSEDQERQEREGRERPHRPEGAGRGRPHAQDRCRAAEPLSAAIAHIRDQLDVAEPAFERSHPAGHFRRSRKSEPSSPRSERSLNRRERADLRLPGGVIDVAALHLEQLLLLHPGAERAIDVGGLPRDHALGGEPRRADQPCQQAAARLDRRTRLLLEQCLAQVARRDPDVLAERQQLGLGQPLTDVLLAGLQLRGALNDALERLATDELARHR